MNEAVEKFRAAVKNKLFAELGEHSSSKTTYERGEKKLTETSETPFKYVLSSEGAATLVAMADKLGVSLDYLLCRTDDPTPPKKPEGGA